MSKKVTLHGIELSLPKYDRSALSIFDYLHKIINRLETGLDKSDENFELSINVDFAANKPPRHKIIDAGTTTKKSKEKVSRILKKAAEREIDHTSGSMKVNLVVDDK